MNGRLLLVFLLVVHFADIRADPILDPCNIKNLGNKNGALWKLLCAEELLSRRSNDAATLKKGITDGAGNQVDVKDTPVPDDSSPEDSNSVNSRQHKAFFVNYPVSQRIYQEKSSSSSSSSRKKPQHQQQQQQQQQVKKPLNKSKKKKPESDIFFIRLPPTPYSYVPGLGYISQPPSFSTASLAGSNKPPRNPFIKLPIDFVSNGKPTSVYRWPPPTKQKPSKPSHNNHHHHHHHHEKYKPDSTIIKLNRGPYVFDGRPESVYLMKRNPPRPNRF